MSRLMTGAPVASEHQVTLDNWRTKPYSQWSFRNVRRLLPTAAIAHDPRAAMPLPQRCDDLGTLSFTTPAGETSSIDQMLAMLRTILDSL